MVYNIKDLNKAKELVTNFQNYNIIGKWIMSKKYQKSLVFLKEVETIKHVIEEQRIQKIIEELLTLNNEQWIFLLRNIDTTFLQYYNDLLPQEIDNTLKELCSSRLYEHFKNGDRYEYEEYDIVTEIEKYLENIKNS